VRGWAAEAGGGAEPASGARGVLRNDQNKTGAGVARADIHVPSGPEGPLAQ